jgi:putative DNA primase/helicase
MLSNALLMNVSKHLRTTGHMSSNAAVLVPLGEPELTDARANAPVELRVQNEPAPQPDRRGFRLTDSGNAEFFAAHYRQDVRYDYQRDRWLVWGRHRWRPDRDGEIQRLVKAAMRKRLQDATAIEDDEQKEREIKHCLSSESRSRREALLALAKAERPLAVSGDRWDSDPWLLGVPNGVVDLRTGGLRLGRRDDNITLTAAVDYTPSAKSELWKQTLKATLIDDELVDFFQVAIGYSATGDISSDVWFLCCGDGRNGKGTLLQPIRRALGEYALELPAAVLDRRTDRAPYELAALPGRRFVTSSESGDTISLHHDRIKQLTGGDSLSAANKYEKAFEFEPICKLWLSCNKKPSVNDDTNAFWARVSLILFEASFVGKEDRNLRPLLVNDPEHQAAILAWIVAGAVRYHAHGLPKLPSTVHAAVAEYREESDPLAGFISEACVLREEVKVGARELYHHYRHWADGHQYTGVERLSATKFGRLLGERFKARKDGRTGVKHYQGISKREPL